MLVVQFADAIGERRSRHLRDMKASGARYDSSRIAARDRRSRRLRRLFGRPTLSLAPERNVTVAAKEQHATANNSVSSRFWAGMFRRLVPFRTISAAGHVRP